MEREIKFRGKQIDNGEWVYGSLLTSGGQINKGAYYICETVTSVFFDKEHNCADLGGFYRVDPKTVGQYTGQKDKNGEELYDGDILHRDCYGDVRIEFEKGVFWIRDTDSVRYANRCCNIPISDFPTEDYEIIGNIHENPELLEVEHA